MADETRRYARPVDEEEPLQLNDLLEPRDAAQHAFYPSAQEEAFNPYEAEDYEDSEASVDEAYDNWNDENDAYAEEEYSDYHEELDHEGRLRTAIGVFNSVSTLVGVVVILILVGMLISLIAWLRADIIHSLTLLQGGIR